MAGAKSYGLPRITYPIYSDDVNFHASPRLLGRYSAGAGPGEEIGLGAFTITGGTLAVAATAQYDLFGRAAAGAGDMAPATRLALNVPGLELLNTYSEGAVWNVTSGNGLTLNVSGVLGGLNVNGDGVAANITASFYVPAANPPIMVFRKARGSLAAPATVNTNDSIGQFNANAYLGTGFTNTAQFSFVMIEPAPGAGLGGTRTRFRNAPVGSATVADTLLFDATNGTYWGGTAAANVTMRADRGYVRRQYTFATLPAAAGVPSSYYEITDGAAAPVWMAAAAGGGAVVTPVHSNGVGYFNG